MIIPHRQLTPEALQGIIEDFATRDGTDYGEVETSLQIKVDHVKRQLDRGQYFILYDAELQTAVLVSKDQLADIKGGED
jgi:uncharacterized protein YheU (UPF0270 family)